jgi:eukaryotic-like serine/threonine-protein kinase
LMLDRSSAIFVPDGLASSRGRLLFVREAALMAQAFDSATLQLTGEPESVAAPVSFSATNVQIAASADGHGSLIYMRNGYRDKRLVWYDRSGAEVGQAPAAGLSRWTGVALAPDGKRFAAVRSDASGEYSVWLNDLERKQDVRLSSNDGSAVSAAWSPDGQRVAFNSGGSRGITVRNLNGGKDETLIDGNGSTVSDWSRDDRWLVYTQNDPKTAADIWLFADPSKPPAGRQPQPLIRTPAVESQAQLSPDGRWIAYNSNESGVSQIYLRPFTGSTLSDTGWNLSASSTSAFEPRWRADSQELFYLQGTRLGGAIQVMSLPIAKTSNPVGVATALFEIQSSTILPQFNTFIYSPTPDGQRFLMSVFANSDQPSLELILNWGATGTGK